MITSKGIKHIRTSRNIKSFQSYCHATGISYTHCDAVRICRELEGLKEREGRRLWLNEQWEKHFERAAGPLRILPPSARVRQS